MHKIDNVTAATTQPTIQPDGPNVGGYFRPANAELGHASTTLDYDFLNAVQNELANVIVGAGMTLSKGSQNQLLLAIQSLIDVEVNNTDPFVVKAVTQAGHGFIAGKYVYFNGTNWLLASAASLDTAWTLGVVQEVLSSSVFRILIVGHTGNIFSGLTPGITYYLSTTTPGGMQATRPSTPGQVVKPVLISDSTASGYFYNWEPFVVDANMGDMVSTNNLSDLEDVSEARTNLGLGTAAVADTDDFIAATDHGDFPLRSNNLSDLFSASTARTNLGLGTAATSAAADFIAATDYGDFAQVSDLTQINSDIDSLETAVAGKQPLDATLTALGGLTLGANNYIYSTAADTVTTGTITPYARTLIDDADAATARTTLALGTAATSNTGDFIPATDYTDFAQSSDLTTLQGTVTGIEGDITGINTDITDIQTNYATTASVTTALASKQPIDTTLTNFAGLAIATDKLPYGSGSDTFALTDLSAYVRTLLDDADAITARATLGLTIGSNVQGFSSILANTSASFTSADETKLDAIEALADVTDELNVVAALSGAGLDAVTVALDDKVVIQDTDDSDSIKTVTVQSIVDLAGGEPAVPDPVQLLDSGTLTGASELLITNLSADFIKYKVIVSDVAASTPTTLRLTTSTDNGSTFDTTSNYTYREQVANSDDAGNLNNTTGTTTSAQLIRDIGPTQTQAGTIELFNPMYATGRTTIQTWAGGIDSGDDSLIQDVMVQKDTAEANNAVRIYPASGIITMRYVIYGYLA